MVNSPLAETLALASLALHNKSSFMAWKPGLFDFKSSWHEEKAKAIRNKGKNLFIINYITPQK